MLLHYSDKPLICYGV